MKARRIRKRCEKCGAVRMARPREVRCKASTVRMGARFLCWGRLAAAPIARAKQPPLSRRQKLDAEHARAYRAQQAAIRRLDMAQRAVVRWRRKVRALERAIAALPAAEQTTRAYFDEAQA